MRIHAGLPKGHEGPAGLCEHDFWRIPIDRKAAVSERTIVVMMARELEEII